MEENQNNENEIVLDNEEVIEVNQEDAVETAENSSEDVKTYTEQEVEEIKSNLKKEYDDKSQKIFDRRWAREKEKLEKANAQLYQIEDVLKTQLGATDRNDLVSKLGDFYNVDISKPTGKLTERQERILAKADAEDLQSLGIDEMVTEANRISSIPKDQRTIHDSVVFENLVKSITETRNRDELNEKGYDLAILEDEKFKDFKSKLNYTTPITEAVDLYNLMTKGQAVGTKPTKPASAGSTKSNVTQSQIKDFYTYEEAMRFSKADFDKNPELYKRVQDSMSKW
jgi:hypothetical protein